MGHSIGEIVQPVELAKQNSATLGIETIDECPHWLGPIGGAEVDGLEAAGHTFVYRMWRRI
jgi:hypothetical protein